MVKREQKQIQQSTEFGQQCVGDAIIQKMLLMGIMAAGGLRFVKDGMIVSSLFLMIWVKDRLLNTALIDTQTKTAITIPETVGGQQKKNKVQIPEDA